MESKIILSLSMLGSNPTRYGFKAPNGVEYKGIQTNEAPAKYLLAQNSKIGQILCLTTPTAQSADNGALAHFKAEIQTVKTGVQIQVIDIPDNGKIPDASMANLLQYLDKDDQVYLDTSGGNRYTVMGVMQLVRLLEYKGVNLQKAVYANLSSRTLDDVTELYRTQNLINGMQELTTFGSVSTLKKYFYGNTTEDGKRIQKLLNAIGNMTDAITLCRLETLERAMAAYQTEMAAASHIKNPIIREMVDLFRDKFGTKITVPWVILWCLEHRMLPQALTVYREWMPKYLLRESGLFTTVPDKLDDRFSGERRNYRNDDVALWEQFIHLSQPEWIDRLDNRYVIETLDKMNHYLQGSGFTVTNTEKVTRAAWDMLYARILRNMILHGNEDATVDPRLMRALEERGYLVNFDTLTASDYIKRLIGAVKQFYKG